MADDIDLHNIRRNYGNQALNEKDLANDPIELFQQWIELAKAAGEIEPTACVLSTVDADGIPDARYILLKAIKNDQFYFYSNYRSPKAEQLESNPSAALTFYWAIQVRQVRLRGVVSKINERESDYYFASRPHLSQIQAIISPQSQSIPSRNFLEAKMQAEEEKGLPLTRPEHWGGYCFSPKSVEFFQGRDGRLHDRILFRREANKWAMERLAP